MSTVIKLVVAALLLNACARVGLAALKQYQFQDAVQQALLFAPDASEADLTQRIVELAEEYRVPLDPADVAFRRERSELFVEAPYVEEVPLVPFVYSQAWTFTPATSVRHVPKPTIQ